jgi:outer membrane lipoprotein carrier protein
MYPFINKFIRCLLVTLALASSVEVSYAGGIERLRSFISNTNAGRAEFVQTVFLESGEVLQKSEGSFSFLRPGKFRWVYKAPYEQLLVGDGVYLWAYDKDLEQVTRVNLDAALGSSPAALLAGSSDIERFFMLESQKTRRGLEWVTIKPYEENTLFARINIGFKKDVLTAMELFDHFGQKTVIEITKFSRGNLSDSNALFTFTPPKGVDLITD